MLSTLPAATDIRALNDSTRNKLVIWQLVARFTDLLAADQPVAALGRVAT
jgi:hypothetical protein